MAAKTAFLYYHPFTDVNGNAAYEIAYSIQSGGYDTQMLLDMVDVPCPFVDTTASPITASVAFIAYPTQTFTVLVGDTSGTPTYYKSVYSIGANSVTASESNISTTLASV